MEAKVVRDHLVLRNYYHFSNVWFSECDCYDFDHYKALPSVIEVQGRLLGKSAWNSDSCVAYYRNDKVIGRAG